MTNRVLNSSLLGGRRSATYALEQSSNDGNLRNVHSNVPDMANHDTDPGSSLLPRRATSSGFSHEPEEVDEEVSSHQEPPSTAHPMMAGVPSHEEMDRLMRWAMIQQQLAAAEAQRLKGHSYGDARLSGNAVAYRGNFVVGVTATVQAQLKNHDYGKIVAEGHAKFYDGDRIVKQNNDTDTRMDGAFQQGEYRSRDS